MTPQRFIITKNLNPNSNNQRVDEGVKDFEVGNNYQMEEDELCQSKTFNKISLQFNNMLKIIDKYLQRVEKK